LKNPLGFTTYTVLPSALVATEIATAGPDLASMTFRAMAVVVIASPAPRIRPNANSFDFITNLGKV
jgi:hypothetical protein